MKTVSSITLGSLLCGFALTTNAATSTILGWNNLGIRPIKEEKCFLGTGFQCDFVASPRRFDLATNLQL